MAVQGTWNFPGFGKDYAVTEALRSLVGKTPSAEVTTKFNNPLVIQQQPKNLPGGNLDISGLFNNPQVLEATTNGSTSGGQKASAGTNYQQGAWYGNSQYWDGQLWPGGWNGGDKGNQGGGDQGGGQGNEQQQISDLYGGQINFLNQLAEEAAGQKQTSLGELIPQEESQYRNISNEQSDLEKALALQGNQITQGAQSGYSDAIRAYNALKQQGMSRYGGGSSTGGAISELIGQQFLRTTGQARQATENARQQLGLEMGKVQTYISQKKSEVDQWKRDAISKINSNFSVEMSNINQNKMETEANKMIAKQDALKQVIADSKAIQQKDSEFKQNLAQWTLEQMQKVSGRAFTPQEVASVYNEVVGHTYAGLTGPKTATNAGGFNFNAQRPRTEEDKLRAAGLLNV
jgi:hypothetical protein